MLLKGSKGTHLCFKVYIQQSKVHTAEWRVCDKFVLAELLLAELLLPERNTFSVWQVSWSLRDRTGTGESSNKLSQSWEVALGWSSSVFASLCKCIPECVRERDTLPRTHFFLFTTPVHCEEVSNKQAHTCRTGVWHSILRSKRQRGSGRHQQWPGTENTNEVTRSNISCGNAALTLTGQENPGSSDITRMRLRTTQETTKPHSLASLKY